jgi:uncharacterized protein (DUF486 family)
MKPVYTIILLIFSNVFMTIAWYGHLKFKELHWFQSKGLFFIILSSWLLAFFEYCFMIPANKFGYQNNGGFFSLIQLKVIQEVISIVIFSLFTILLFKTETFKWNHILSFVFIILAVYFAFKK